MALADVGIGVLIGIVVGWNVLPQPAWIKRLWDKKFKKD